MLKLPDITLVTLGDEAHKEQNQNALDYSCQGVVWGGVKNIVRPIKDIDDWSRQIVFDLGDFITTDYALLIHPDGFVVNPDKWRDEFLDYDYVGAPWPIPFDDFSYRDRAGDVIRVGNSVSLRSKRLLDLPKQIGMSWEPFHGFYNEDGAICVNYRHYFLGAGMRFAPLEVAKYFSKEHALPENYALKTFAFHKHMGENSVYPNFEE